jgi:chaperonin GroES
MKFDLFITGDRLIVIRVEAVDRAAARVFLQESEEETAQIGSVVVATREQAFDDGYLSSLDIACGDRILYSRYAGREIRLEGERYLILREDEVIGVCDGEDVATNSHTVSLSAFSKLHPNCSHCLLDGGERLTGDSSLRGFSAGREF